MDQILSGVPGVLCYLDDILVTGKDEEEHLRNLDATLQRLRDYGLRVRKDKCAFFQSSIEYLGHVIDAQGLHKAPSKVKAILDAPVPQNVRNIPQLAPLHPWDWPEEAWHRIHVDFAGPFEDRMFLVMVDAHSKWPEVAIMKSTTAGKTIEKLGEVFSRFGSPLQLVSDNGPQLVSQEMTTFLQVNGVQHIRNTPHATTKASPASLLMKRELRTSFDLLRPPTTKEIVQRQQERQVERRGFKAKDREFNPGETVLARNYLNGPKWVPAKVIAQSGPVSYTVQTTEDTIWKRHADQLLSSKAAPTEPTIVSGQDLLLGENQSEHSPPPRGSQAPPQDPDVTNSKQMCDETLMQTTQLPTPESTAEHKNGVNENQVESRYPTRERRAPMRMNL
ncbi:hypothetical protein DPEC_G00029910 [Dallia pectoralis]|uniref:Uncharacterized protein n=1 Tax=Dallia pectoralis TaxID=75939 RepID=A0ACC2HBT2_DALPE|nr:hypothetical protein DPEC_G00029910 [Dallia pectoralis]